MLKKRFNANAMAYMPFNEIGVNPFMAYYEQIVEVDDFMKEDY